MSLSLSLSLSLYLSLSIFSVRSCLLITLIKCSKVHDRVLVNFTAFNRERESLGKSRVGRGGSHYIVEKYIL